MGFGHVLSEQCMSSPYHGKIHEHSVTVQLVKLYRQHFANILNHSIRLMKVDSQFPVTPLRLETNADQIIHYFE